MTGSAAAILVAVVASGLLLTVDREPSVGPAPAMQAVPGDWIVFEHFGQAPDGSTSEMDFDRRQIWLVKPDGSELHELAPGLPIDGKTSPDVSPDGTRVVFSSWTPRSLLWEADLAGGDPELLSIGCSGLPDDCQEWDPSYSPDGTRIAFVHQGSGQGVGGPSGGDLSTTIAIRDTATSEVTYLDETRVPIAEGWLNQPTWSPDGTQIAYHRTTEQGDEYPSPIRIWIVNDDGSGLRELATPADEDAADPDWSPDGSRIVYSTVGFRESEGVSGLDPLIYTIRPDGSDARLICNGLAGVEGCWAPSWTPDGDSILYWGYLTWNTMAADGSDKRVLGDKLRYYGTTLGYGYSAIWQPQLIPSIATGLTTPTTGSTGSTHAALWAGGLAL